jgi:hypothetical protein
MLGFEVSIPPHEMQQLFRPENGYQNSRPPLLKSFTGILRSLRAWRIATVLAPIQAPALIAVVERAGPAVALQRHTQVVRPDRHLEFA